MWLVAYFWHVTRPLLAFLMDPELKVKSCFKKPFYDLVSTTTASNSAPGGLNRNGQNLGQKSQNLHSLKVMLSPEITTESDENELTSLNNQEICKNSNFSEENQNSNEQIKDIIKKHKRSDLIEENNPDQPEDRSLHSTIVAV